jgi:hypothetical protein
MRDHHWKWCRQAAVFPDVMDPAVKQIMSQIALPPCPCRTVTDEMRFIRLAWLLDEGRALHNLPRMQDLPRDAFIPLEDMRYAYFISHRWLSREHPDRSGQQLAVALSCIWNADGTGLWYDYLCLPQLPRSQTEEGAFLRLLPQVAWLTLTTVPLLVVDGSHEYASRAWCVAEAMGAYRSGLEFRAVSLAAQMARYKEVLLGRTSAWDSAVDIESGYRSGVAKLRSWIEEEGPSVDASPTQQQKDARKHFKCMRSVAEVAFALHSVAGRGSVTSDSALKAIAAHYNLQCTYQDDVLRCMRLMLDVLKFGDIQSR